VSILRTIRPTGTMRSPAASLRAATFAGLEGSTRWLHDAREVTLARQIAIAAIAAPTGKETERGDAIAAHLTRLGITDVRRDDAGNVIARLPGIDVPRNAAAEPANDASGETAPVVVMAHLDTVFTETALPPARYDGSRVYASGIGDNGRGLAALVTLGDVLRRDECATRHTHPIELVATVGEEGEGNLRGARYYFDQRALAHAPSPIAVVALDGPGDSLIVHHAIASRRLRFSYAGEGGHPWANASAANAVHAVGRAIAAIAQLADAQPSGVTITVTRVGGGESLTSVPAHGWFDVDLRTLDHSAMSRVSDAVRRLAERARTAASRRDAGLTMTVDVLGDRPGGALDAAHPLVRLAADATTWQGIEPRSASASSDANIPLSRGIPAITIGAGGAGGGAHTAQEWYDDTNGPRGMARALGIVMAAANDGIAFLD